MQGDGIHCQEKAQMVLKSSSAQMTSPEQLASTGREEKFNSGQSGPGLSPLNLVTSWCPLPSLCSSCVCLFPSSSHPGCLCAAQNASLLCVHLLTAWHLGGDGHRLGAKFSFVFSQVLICIQGPGPGHSFNLIKPGRNEVCMN